MRVFLQTWRVKTGDSLAVINGSGLGVKPVIFFHDSIRLASAQEKGVLVSCSVHTIIIYPAYKVKYIYIYIYIYMFVIYM